MSRLRPVPDFTTRHSIILPVAGRARRVIIHGSLLQRLWSASGGPQTAEGIIGDNLKLFARMVAAKIAKGSAEAEGQSPIELTAGDWEI